MKNLWCKVFGHDWFHLTTLTSPNYAHIYKCRRCKKDRIVSFEDILPNYPNIPPPPPKSKSTDV